MDFLVEYGMFLAQAITIVIAITLIIAAIASAGQKNKKQAEGHLEIVNLSEEIQEIKEGVQKELLTENEYKELLKEKKKQEKEESKLKKIELKKAAKEKKKDKATESKSDSAESNNESESDDSKSELQNKDDGHKGKIFVLDFDGDIEASAVENLREEINAIVTAASQGDKVLLRLESPGGMVHAYGLAASQLTRIKEAKLELIISVDQVAASGGYMMACVADKIIAAPFAIVGSIGVIAELPNFHRLLQHNKVDYEQHTAGEYKRTLTMFSENTEAARTKFKQELDETHQLFKQFIVQNRAKLDIDKVATGEHWYGLQALELGLIDKIQISDDFIIKAVSDYDVYSVSYEIKKSFTERFAFSIRSAVEKGVLAVWQKNIESRLFKG